jgi:pimeloyl-ACP methyl ester carboxylesterase
MMASVCVAPAQNASEAERTVNVGDHKLYLRCTGKTPGPLVLLEAGALGTSHTWGAVQSSVEKFARVCSYDRAGLGKSDKPPLRQTADEIVKDLHELLLRANTTGPYVLVGHSLGGIYVRSFTSKYPDQVSGLVLVDSSHEEQISRYAAISPTLAERFAIQFGIRDPESTRQQGFLSRGRLVWHFDIPLRVLEHRYDHMPKQAMTEADQVEAAWHSMQQDLAGRSKYGTLREAERSGHFIQTDQPELVTESIRDVVKMSSRPSQAASAPRSRGGSTR